MKEFSNWVVGWNRRFKYKKLTIVKKMVIGYILLVFLPVILFGALFQYMSYENVLKNIMIGNQSLVDQAANSLDGSLAQVESIYPLFQNNSPVKDYLSGQYQTEVDQVYHYLKEIRPIFTFADTANESVTSVKLYSIKKNLMPVPGEVENLESLHTNKHFKQINKLMIGAGKWIPIKNGTSEVPSFAYYQKVYNTQYSNELAYLEVLVNQQIITNFLEAINVKNKSDVVILQGDELVFKSPGIKPDSKSFRDAVTDRLEGTNKDSFYWKEEKLIVNSLDTEKLDLRFFFLSPTDEVAADMRNKTILLGTIMVILLIILSAIYYLTASILTKRVLNLAKHMRKVDHNNLAKLDDEGYQDELGFLTRSFNSMIERINDLINKVHKAELMKKEADYLVLQAQIKPHFLYNTLESIRMMAEINDDPEVVDATYTFGKLLRYSLSPRGNETSLRDEIENINYFLKIHKIRMMDRLQYEIKIEEDIDRIRCPRFILQPLVENSINHGLSKIRGKGFIRIHIKKEDEFILIKIADNGAGIPPDRLEIIHGVLSNQLDRGLLQTKESGMGLYNVSERIKAFYGKESSFEIHSTLGEGTAYVLKLKI
ncbi:sensor histidine kinase [Mesobacillus foraminis]|uniref:sensor histidine kinase n=1 Tax=Mesobacillus foraminis TaxID=279826 RepID=UPI001BE8F693|nr:sensor histidine kinase [Mesobacillus foraminis]MBT2757800.1 sensor histidine kinase [Mesobacillus foraminis]